MNKLTDRMTWAEIVEQTAARTGYSNNNDFKNWMLSKESCGYIFDYFLWGHCYAIQKKLSTNRDHFTVIVGSEGSGKSTMGMQACSVISPRFSKDNICYEMIDFINNMKHCKPGDSILLDEGAIFLFSRSAMDKDTKRIIQLITLMRQLNLHVCVCIPRFSILDKYVREERVDTLLSIYKQGSYKGVVAEGIDEISKQMLKFKDINTIKIKAGTFWKGYWNNQLPPQINFEDYAQLKREHFMKVLVRMGKELKFDESLQNRYIKVREAMKMLNMGEEAIKQHIRDKTIPGIIIGTRYYVDKHKLLEKSEEKRGN